MTETEGYLLDNQQVEAGQRFDAFAELFDPPTFRHLTAVGLGPGWRVWEVGAGGRSVPAWLARQVGGDGRVLATDIDTRWVSGAPGVEVLRHDVGSHPVPDGPFDLVRCRRPLDRAGKREADARGNVVQRGAAGAEGASEADLLCCHSETCSSRSG